MIRPSEIFLRGAAPAVLLIHGLTGTPNELRTIAYGLHQAGHTVLCMQLAGHCGDEQDLIATSWHDWVRSVELAAHRLLQHADRIFVGGLSMGALLALRYAIDHPATTRAAVLYGTTFFYDGWAIPRLARLAFVLPWIDRLGIGRRRVFMETYPYGLKSEMLRKLVFEKMHSGDSSAAGLPGNPWPALAQFYRLSRSVRRDLGRVNCPCLAIHARDDDVASVRNVQLLERAVPAPVEALFLDESYHMVTLDQERREVIARTRAFFAKQMEAENQPLPQAVHADAMRRTA